VLAAQFHATWAIGGQEDLVFLDQMLTTELRIIAGSRMRDLCATLATNTHSACWEKTLLR
jgi:hypothetical protein